VAALIVRPVLLSARIAHVQGFGNALKFAPSFDLSRNTNITSSLVSAVGVQFNLPGYVQEGESEIEAAGKVGRWQKEGYSRFFRVR
jgi:hypothetical protein